MDQDLGTPKWRLVPLQKHPAKPSKYCWLISFPDNIIISHDIPISLQFFWQFATPPQKKNWRCFDGPRSSPARCASAATSRHQGSHRPAHLAHADFMGDQRSNIGIIMWISVNIISDPLGFFDIFCKRLRTGTPPFLRGTVNHRTKWAMVSIAICEITGGWILSICQWLLGCCVLNPLAKSMPFGSSTHPSWPKIMSSLVKTIPAYEYRQKSHYIPFFCWCKSHSLPFVDI